MYLNYMISNLVIYLATIYSILIIKYRKKEYDNDNKCFGFFILISLFIQFLNFLSWFDVKNENALGKILSVIVPILNISVPFFLYLVKVFYYKPVLYSMKDFSLQVTLINIFFFFYLLYVSYNFILPTNNKKNILSKNNEFYWWFWINELDPCVYLLVFAVNIFYKSSINYSISLFLLTYLFLLLSIFVFPLMEA